MHKGCSAAIYCSGDVAPWGSQYGSRGFEYRHAMYLLCVEIASWLGLFLVPLHSIVNEWRAMVVESPVRNLIRFRSCLKRICHRQTTLKGIRNFDNFSKTFLNHSLKWKALQCIVDCNVFFLGACELLYIICILINRYDRFWGNILQ